MTKHRPSVEEAQEAARTLLRGVVFGAVVVLPTYALLWLVAYTAGDTSKTPLYVPFVAMGVVWFFALLSDRRYWGIWARGLLPTRKEYRNDYSTTEESESVRNRQTPAAR